MIHPQLARSSIEADLTNLSLENASTYHTSNPPSHVPHLTFPHAYAHIDTLTAAHSLTLQPLSIQITHLPDFLLVDASFTHLPTQTRLYLAGTPTVNADTTIVKFNIHLLKQIEITGLESVLFWAQIHLMEHYALQWQRLTGLGKEMRFSWRS